MSNADEIQPVPPRPWTVTETDDVIRVSSIETNESVFWINLEGRTGPQNWRGPTSS
jgi:hypothetical protein